MSKGDLAHAAQHKHGVQPRFVPPIPRTIEQRVAALEERMLPGQSNRLAQHAPTAEVREENLAYGACSGRAGRPIHIGH